MTKVLFCLYSVKTESIFAIATVYRNPICRNNKFANLNLTK